MNPTTPPTQNDIAIEKSWNEMREKTMGQLISIRCSNGQHKDFNELLVELELERRKFVRDVLIDRWLSIAATVISIVSISATIYTTMLKPAQIPIVQVVATPSVRIAVLTNVLDKTLQSVATNKSPASGISNSVHSP